MGKSSGAVLTGSRFVVVRVPLQPYRFRDHGSIPHRSAFAIGDVLAVSFNHLIGAR
jgi:hypothetical protein